MTVGQYPHHASIETVVGIYQPLLRQPTIRVLEIECRANTKLGLRRKGQA